MQAGARPLHRRYHRGVAWKGWLAEGLGGGQPPLDVIVRWADSWDSSLFGRDPHVR